MKNKTKTAVAVGVVLGATIGVALAGNSKKKPPKQQVYGVPPYSKPVQRTYIRQGR